MKRIFIPHVVVTLIAVLILFSCRSEHEDGIAEVPHIQIEEVGINNTQIVYPGQDLHIQAKIHAPSKIASVKLQITLATTNYGWDFIHSYTGYIGLQNADFHEHIDIPEDVAANKYTLLIVVTDELGQKVQQKVDFEIKKDPSLPVINNIDLKVISPQQLNLSGNINAPGKFDRIEVEVQSSAWTKNYTYADPGLVGQTSFQLDQNIDISGAPAGHYHINVKLYDQSGKSMFYQFHIDR